MTRRLLFWGCGAILVALAATAAAIYWKPVATGKPGTETVSDPQIEYPARVDLGDREFGDVAVARYTITNRGGAELVVSEVRVNCACSGLEREENGSFTRSVKPN